RHANSKGRGTRGEERERKTDGNEKDGADPFVREGTGGMRGACQKQKGKCDGALSIIMGTGASVKGAGQGWGKKRKARRVRVGDAIYAWKPSWLYSNVNGRQ